MFQHHVFVRYNSDLQTGKKKEKEQKKEVKKRRDRHFLKLYFSYQI